MIKKQATTKLLILFFLLLLPILIFLLLLLPSSAFLSPLLPLLVFLSSLLFFSVFFFHCCFPQSFNLQLCPSQLYQHYQRFCHCLSQYFCPYLSFFIFFPGPPHYSYLFLSNASFQINFTIISKSLYSLIFCQPTMNIQIIITTRYR